MGEEAEVYDRDGVEVEVVVHGSEGHGIERLRAREPQREKRVIWEKENQNRTGGRKRAFRTFDVIELKEPQCFLNLGIYGVWNGTLLTRAF